jgi:DNA-3-methyladenine glycosylase
VIKIKQAPIPLSYYQQEDVLALGSDLLGKVIVLNNRAAIISETESYRGPEDRASHAYNLRRTKRNEVMYACGGHAYVYLSYGIHYCFKVVTNKKDIPHAILVRGVILDGKQIVGPGNVTRALGINLSHNGLLLDRPPLWLEDHKIRFEEVERLPRVGVKSAGPDAELCWRFRGKGSLSQS